MLNPSIFSRIFGTPMVGDHIKLVNPYQLYRYTPYDISLVDEIFGKGNISMLKTHDLKKKFLAISSIHCIQYTSQKVAYQSSLYHG